MAEQTAEGSNYYLFQLTGWTLFLLFNSVILLLSGGFNLNIFYIYLLTTALGFVISHAYRLVIKTFDWTKLKIATIIGRTVISNLLMAFFWASLTLIFADKVYGEISISAGMYLGLSFSMMIVFFIWSLIYFFYHIFFYLRKSEIDKYKLSLATKESQLEVLKAQINPHFIFNSLNNIRSLISEEPEKARDMVTRLSGLFRYNLKIARNELVNLKEEIEIVVNYLNLESIQLEDRLDYDIKIEEGIDELKIPPMTIQLLVENAVKHGINILPEGGTINISVNRTDDQLIIEVVNSGQIVKNNREKGIGLKNATERIKLLLGSSENISLENFGTDKVKATLSIPVKK